jgi:hypothetical protein
MEQRRRFKQIDSLDKRLSEEARSAFVKKPQAHRLV